MFINLKVYYEAIAMNPFDFIPLTFHIKNGVEDVQYKKFAKAFEEYEAEKQNK